MYRNTVLNMAPMQQLIDEAYLPLMSGALMQTQKPQTAAGIVRDVFLKVANSQTTEWSPVRLFMEMLQCTFRTLMQQSETNSPIAEDTSSPVPENTASYAAPVYCGSDDTPRMPNRCRLTEVSTIESWLLYPLLQDDPDRLKRGIKAGLLCWLSSVKSDAYIVALLAAWFQYHPTRPDARAILEEISYLIGFSPQRVHHIWEEQQQTWNQFLTEDGPSLLDAMRVWLECINLSKEDFRRTYLTSLEYPLTGVAGNGTAR